MSTPNISHRVHDLRARIFDLVVRRPGLSQKEVAKRLRISRGRLTEQLYRMGLSFEKLHELAVVRVDVLALLKKKAGRRK
jgi:hypothetical protein